MREDEDAAGVVGRQVVVDVGPGRVLDLDARDVLLDRVAPDDDVLRLADVDAGVGGADDLAVLDHHVGAEHGIDPVAAVGLLRAAGPLGADVAEDDPLGPLDLDRVTPGVFDGEVLEGDVLLAGDEQPLAAGPLPLVLEAEDRLVRPLAADGHAADVERERGPEVEPARAELDDVARLGVDHRRLGPLRGVRAGLDLHDAAAPARGGWGLHDVRHPVATGGEHRGNPESQCGNVHDAATSGLLGRNKGRVGTSDSLPVDPIGTQGFSRARTTT